MTLNMKSKKIHCFATFAIRTWLTNLSLHDTSNMTSVLCMTIRRMGF